MSGLPPIPPRPDRTKVRSPAPTTVAAPAGNGSGNTLGSDIPVIPPRPKRRIDRSQSPSKPLSPSIPTQEHAVAAPGVIIQTQDGSDLVALNKTSTPTAAFPPATLEPPVPEQLKARIEQQNVTHTPIPEIRTVSEDLELQTPKPTLPRRSNTEKSDKLEAITRTDSGQIAEMDLEEPKNEVRGAHQGEDKPAVDQLEPETHDAIMKSVGQTEPFTEMDLGEPFSHDEMLRKPTEIDDHELVNVASKKEEPAQPGPTKEQQDIVEEKMQKETEIRQADEEAFTIDTSSATRDNVSGQVLFGLDPSMTEAHQESANANTSDIQLGDPSTCDPHVNKNTLAKPEEDSDMIQEVPAHTTESSEKLKAVPEPLKLGSNVPERFDFAEAEEEKLLESPHQALQEDNTTDKNELDEIIGEPAEPVSLAILKKECAVEDISATSSPPTPPGEASKSSIEAVSDIQGERMESQIPEERPTTGAVAFHQEKKAEGIPLSTEEGRATTGVAAVMSKPAIPARPKKKLTDPKPSESRPVPVPAGLPQVDGPQVQSVQEPAHTLPSAASKPPVPLASKPAIPPRPARPLRPTKKDSLNGSEGAPLTTVSSASSARSLFEAGGQEAAAAAKAKPKPPVPARPIGNKIAALQGGFLSELNKKLKIGPTAPVKEELAKEDESIEAKPAAPLVDARKGRARGPQRRAPARAAAPAKETSPAARPAAPVTLKLSLSTPITVWKIAPNDGDIILPFGETTLKSKQSKQPEIEVKADTTTITEFKSEIDDSASSITKDETEESEEAKQDIKSTSPSAVSEAEKDVQAANSSWTGTTALGAVAMGAQEVISQTAASASKTIKDFTEGEEHVLSDVDDKDSATVSEVESTPPSPKLLSVIQNDGPNEIETQAESLAATEVATSAEAAAPLTIPLDQPPKLEETQHPSETDFPPPLQSSEAPTVLRSPDSAETDISINTAANRVAQPEMQPATKSVAETIDLGTSGAAAEKLEEEAFGDVLVQGSDTETTPQLPDTTVEQLKELKKVENKENGSEV